MTAVELYALRKSLKEQLAAVELVIGMLEKGNEPVTEADPQAPLAEAKQPSTSKPTETVPEPSKSATPAPPARPGNPENIWEDWQVIKLVQMKGERAPASEIGTAIGKTPVQVNNKWTQHKEQLKKAEAAGERAAPSARIGGADGRTDRGNNMRRTS